MSTIVTTAVRDVAHTVGGFATEVFEIRDAARRAPEENRLGDADLTEPRDCAGTQARRRGSGTRQVSRCLDRARCRPAAAAVVRGPLGDVAQPAAPGACDADAVVGHAELELTEVHRGLDDRPGWRWRGGRRWSAPRGRRPPCRRPAAPPSRRSGARARGSARSRAARSASRAMSVIMSVSVTDSSPEDFRVRMVLRICRMVSSMANIASDDALLAVALELVDDPCSDSPVANRRCTTWSCRSRAMRSRSSTSSSFSCTWRADSQLEGDRGLRGERRGEVELGVGEGRVVLEAPEQQHAGEALGADAAG